MATQDFTGVNGTDVRTLTDWDGSQSTLGTGGGAFEIQSNQASNICANNIAAADWYTGGTIGNNQYSQAVVKSVANGVYIGVAVRCGGTDNGTSVDGYFFYSDPADASAVDVYVDGTYDSTIASGGTPFAVNDVIYIEISGYNIVCKINGGLVFNFTDSGSHIASGRPGICAYDVGTSALDDWQGGELLAAVNVTLDTAVLTATGIPIADIVAPVSRTMKTAMYTRISTGNQTNDSQLL